MHEQLRVLASDSAPAPQVAWPHTQRERMTPTIQPAVHELETVAGRRVPSLAAGEGLSHELTQVGQRRAGESEGPEPDETQALAGEADAPQAAAEDDAPEAAAGEKDEPTITVTQKAKELTNSGSAEYKVQWSVSDAKANGWIIQHVRFSGSKKDCDGKDVATNTTGQEYWEGWQVRNGKVFVGSGTSAHVADTFRTVDEGKTVGTLQISGKVAYKAGYDLKEPPWGHDVAAAGALPTMKKAPDGWDDAAAKDHTMTVKWDACAKTPTHSVTTSP